MVKGLYTSCTGMINEQKRVDVVANNLANASTVGYKAEGATSESFKDVLAYKIKDTSEYGLKRKLGSMSPGVKIGETYTDFSEGAFHETDNVYDMAISGKGFFTVEFANRNGEKTKMYTRAGDFKVLPNGSLVNGNGDYVLDVDGKHITLNPLAQTTIGENGTIFQDGEEVAQLKITDFEDYNYLLHYGETYFSALDGAVELEEAEGIVYSGMVEQSNIQVATEMVNLISYQRAYETNQKMLKAHDETLEVAVTDLGKV